MIVKSRGALNAALTAATGQDLHLFSNFTTSSIISRCLRFGFLGIVRKMGHNFLNLLKKIFLLITEFIAAIGKCSSGPQMVFLLLNPVK